MTITDADLTEAPTAERGRKRLWLLGAAAGVVALVAVPIVAIAADSGSPEANVEACAAVSASFRSLAVEGKEDKDRAQSDLAAGNQDNLDMYAERLYDHARSMEDLDTAACEAVAPSLDLVIAATAEGYKSLSYSLNAAAAGLWDMAEDFIIEANEHLAEANSLGDDAVEEMEQTKDDLGM